MQVADREEKGDLRATRRAEDVCGLETARDFDHNFRYTQMGINAGLQRLGDNRFVRQVVDARHAKLRSAVNARYVAARVKRRNVIKREKCERRDKEVGAPENRM